MASDHLDVAGRRRAEQYDNLFHIVSADPCDAFTFDLEYTAASGIITDAADGTVPSMQLAFQYSALVPDGGSGSNGGKGSSQSQR